MTCGRRVAGREQGGAGVPQGSRRGGPGPAVRGWGGGAVPAVVAGRYPVCPEGYVLERSGGRPSSLEWLIGEFGEFPESYGWKMWRRGRAWMARRGRSRRWQRGRRGRNSAGTSAGGSREVVAEVVTCCWPVRTWSRNVAHSAGVNRRMGALGVFAVADPDDSAGRSGGEGGAFDAIAVVGAPGAFGPHAELEAGAVSGAVGAFPPGHSARSCMLTHTADSTPGREVPAGT